MKVELQRAFSPASLRETQCSVCALPFRPESVIAYGHEAHEVCPECISCLGARNAEQFPTIEKYRAALRRYPEPLFATDEEYKAAEAAMPPYHDTISAEAEIHLER